MQFVTDILCGQLHLDESEVLSALGNFDVIPFEYKGEVTGAAVIAGNEIHFVAKPECRGRCGARRQIRDFLTGLLAEKEFLTTRIPVDTPPKDRTGERMGFTWTWSDGQFDYYILTELPYARV